MRPVHGPVVRCVRQASSDALSVRIQERSLFCVQQDAGTRRGKGDNMSDPSPESLAEAAKLYDDIAAIARTLAERDEKLITQSRINLDLSTDHEKAKARIAALEAEVLELNAAIEDMELNE